MLPVTVERHDGVALGVIEPGGERRLVAEVAAQLQDRHAAVVARRLHELGRRMVDRAVVDVADPDVVLAPQRRHHVHQPPVELGHDGFLVVDGDDDVDREPPLGHRHVGLGARSTPRRASRWTRHP